MVGFTTTLILLAEETVTVDTFPLSFLEIWINLLKVAINNLGNNMLRFLMGWVNSNKDRKFMSNVYYLENEEKYLKNFEIKNSQQFYPYTRIVKC